MVSDGCFKGTHMSRFIEVLNRHRGEVTMKTIPTILHELREHLEAESATLIYNITSTYFYL